MIEPLAAVEVGSHDGHPVIRVSGDVDLSNAQDLGEQIRARIGEARTAYVDLGSVGFFDSQGLRMLQQLSDGLTDAGTRLVVIAPPAGIAGSILSLTGMDENLDVRPDLPAG